MPDYQQNLAQAQFKPMPEDLVQLRRALRDNPAETHRFYLAIEGMIPRETFFNPENLGRVIGASAH